MITQINHSLNLETINENDFSNINILDDRDNVHFCYQNIPFRFSVFEIGYIFNKADVTLFKIQAIEKILGITLFFGDDDEDLDFHWCELTYNLSKYDFIQLACMLPNLWEFHSEIIESDENSITFYAHKEDEESEEIIYSLQSPEQEAQKVKLCFMKNAYQIFKGLENVKIDFTASYSYNYASIENENVFLADQRKDVDKLLQIQKLTPTTEENYELFFDIEFSCIVKNGKAIFTIGNFTFEYEF